MTNEIELGLFFRDGEALQPRKLTYCPAEREIRSYVRRVHAPGFTRSGSWKLERPYVEIFFNAADRDFAVISAPTSASYVWSSKVKTTNLMMHAESSKKVSIQELLNFFVTNSRSLIRRS